jgi:hypothetical protein
MNYEAVLGKVFDADSASIKEQCAVTPVRPVFDFSLRFQAGFALDVPQDSDTPHRYVVVLRITPESGPPAYLLSRVQPPRIYGSFEVGPGRYKVEMILGDNRREVCRGQWSVEAKADPIGQHLASTAGNLGKLTILMSVMPPSPGLSKLPENDEWKLMGALFALSTRLNAESVRVVVFDLEQQRVLFTEDGFTPADVKEVGTVIDQAQFGVIHYSALRHPVGAVDLLAQLTEQEQAKLHGLDALVFLGPPSGVRASMPSRLVKKLQDGPRIFYLDCVNPPSLADASRVEAAFSITAESASAPVQADQGHLDDPNVAGNPVTAPMRNDIIEQMVKHLKGKVIPIRTPADCARAIQRIMPR